MQNDLPEALVGAGGEAQEREEQDQQILQADPEARTLVGLAPGYQLYDRREDQGQGRRAESSDERDEQAQSWHQFRNGH